MSEENKTVELKDEDLEEVNGGFSQDYNFYTFDAGDCFEYTLYNFVIQIKVKYPYNNVSQYSTIICDERMVQNGVPMSVYETEYTANNKAFNKDNFKGKNMFDF